MANTIKVRFLFFLLRIYLSASGCYLLCTVVNTLNNGCVFLQNVSSDYNEMCKYLHKGENNLSFKISQDQMEMCCMVEAMLV